jgi:hypothetical protein
MPHLSTTFLFQNQLTLNFCETYTVVLSTFWRAFWFTCPDANFLVREKNRRGVDILFSLTKSLKNLIFDFNEN